MNGEFECRTCCDSGRLADRRGNIIACPYCTRGAEYARQLAVAPPDARHDGAKSRPSILDRLLPRRRPAGTSPAPAPAAANGEGWTPAQAAFVLKAMLYASAAAAAFALYHFTQSSAEDGERDMLKLESPEADVPAEYSPWEPES